MTARADTWGEVADYAHSLLAATRSRLRNYRPAERARRRAHDEALIARVQLMLRSRDANEALDAARIFPEMVESVGGFEDNGDGTQSYVSVGDAVPKRDEIAVRGLVTQFRRDLTAALGDGLRLEVVIEKD